MFTVHDMSVVIVQWTPFVVSLRCKRKSQSPRV